MKRKKIFKFFLITNILVPLSGSIVLSTVSCGHKDSGGGTVPGATWDDFKTNAQAESKINIVKQTKPNGWDDAVDTQLKIDSFTPDQTNNKITEAIIRTVSGQKTKAIFEINYTKGQKYNIKDWKCESQPIPINGGGLGYSKSVPFLDITSTVTNKITPDKVYKTFGIHQIMASFANVFTINGKVTIGWTGSERFDDSTTAEAKWVSQYEALGGKVGISFGGADASGHKITPWDMIKDATTLANDMKVAISQYKAKAIDFDIEPPGNFDAKEMNTLVAATNIILKDNPTIDISLTLASVPTDKNGTKFWGGVADHSSTGVAAFKKFTKTPIINPMLFDFGAYYITDQKFYEPEIEKTITQTATYWANIFGIDESNFIKNNIEATTMIGRSDQAVNDKGHLNREVLTKAAAITLAKFCKTNQVFRMGFWSLNRDFPGKISYVSPSNNGTDNPAGTYSKVNIDNFEK